MRVCTFIAKQELYAEKLLELAQAASYFESDTYLLVRDRAVDMKSILGLCSILLRPGDTAEIRISGHDEEEAMLTIKQWFHL